MNTYFTPISNIIGLFAYSYPEVKPFPKLQAILEAFNHLRVTFCASAQKIQRIWRVLTLLSAWGFKILQRVMRCYPSAPKSDKIAHVSLEKKKVETASFDSMPLDKKDFVHLDKAETEEARHIQKIFDELVSYEELFNNPIPYEQLRDTILSIKDKKKEKEFLFGNYSLEAYTYLQDCDFKTVLSYPTEQERDLYANIATYDAIVSLYVSRFLEENPHLNNDKYLSSLRTIALTIAIKMSWDQRVWNKNFVRIISPYLGLEKHMKMEFEFLKSVHWNLSIHELLFQSQTKP